MKYIISQIIGLAGVTCFVLSYQIKSNKGLYIIQTIGNALFATQFLMIGALTGSINVFVLVIRNLMLSMYNESAFVRWAGWKWIFSAVSVLIMIFTKKGWYDLIPCVATIGGNFGMWSNNAQTIRLTNLVCISPGWLIYDIIVGSWSGILNEVIALTSIIVSIVRFGWKAMGEEDSSFRGMEKTEE